MDNETRTTVRCYSGRKADERPVSFRLDAVETTVERIAESWLEPDYECFKVVGHDKKVYILKRHISTDTWRVRQVGKRRS